MLDWHSATSEHRPHLSAFCCTLPDHGWFDEEAGFICHDYPWELEVQEFVRSLRPALSPPEFLLLGYDEAGLAATLAIRVAPLDRWALIQAVAVAQRASGNGLAGEAISLAPRVMAKYDLDSNFMISARIDPRNHSAKSAFLGSGYEMTGLDDAFESWARRF